MFGADTALVWDAIQIGVLALGAGAGGAWLFLRHRTSRNSDAIKQAQSGSLEERVRVLERIATDRPSELAAEIEALRNKSVEAK
ncbi:hypothetical protein [Aurantiacibacter sp. D1-12]|uniref:hypothetical protein n=1 Tax=Aurantiacibacter sp. D1-12 TaxID=2993658 RepID=UPI00237C9275|nr:hypothetical protein [Aurantiacibacter sp. D1-12]MDE1466156.1 hypothetical protein [Aurantiacibacter sp. D1-12]